MKNLRSEAEAIRADLHAMYGILGKNTAPGEAADIITKLLSALGEATEQVERAERALKIVQGAAKTLSASKDSIIHNLQKPRREEREAVATLDSERSANEILTAENDALRAELAKVTRERDEARSKVIVSDGEILDAYQSLQIDYKALHERQAQESYYLASEIARITSERDVAREGERVAIETRDRFERGWLDTIKERDAAREAIEPGKGS